MDFQNQKMQFLQNQVYKISNSMSKGVRSTQSIFQFFKWKITRKLLERKQNKAIRFYEQQKYDKLAALFKSQKDYEQIKIDQFPFLYFMISENKTAAVQKFLQKYPHKDSMFMNDNNPLNCTPMQYAILENKEQVEKVLEQNGGNIHVNNTEGQNVMHLAAIFRRKEAFDLCIRRNIDFNHVDQHGNTPFHYACRAGSVEMMTALIAAKAKKIANHLNQYPIHMAIESGKMQCVNLLDNDIMRPYPKFHPIHSAARCNNLLIFRHIYQKNPKFIQQKDENNSTPLHHATSVQDYQIVKFILQRLPKNPTPILEAKDSYGNTPLHLAFLNSNIDIIRELIQRKANLQVKNNDELTPLDYGLTSQNVNVKRFLMDLEGWKQHGEKKY